ncbi:MAG: ornithine cyclodeaminase family protein [Acidimicrobiia bacterium]|nr:MAG: ornithine cyclodeaminase family protein [Acidimicrobiia bacterium]
MRYLDATATRRALTMSAAISAMERAFGDDRQSPIRTRLGPSLFMPGRVGSDTGVKVVSTVPGRPLGIVAVFGGDGACRGLVDGPTLTAIRTAAGAGLATRLLARPDARTMAMLGAGAMAYDQVVAVREVRPIDEVLVWSRVLEHAEALARRLDATPIADPSQAVAEADVVTTATPSTSPLFDPEALRPGTHLNAVGAFTPEMCEIPPAVVMAARVFVDDFDAAASEAGDLLRADRQPDGTVADLLAGRVRGRTSADQVTFFKSVGIAPQDVAAAVAALDRAEKEDIGLLFG